MSADLEAQLAKVTAERDDLVERWRALHTVISHGKGVFAGGKVAWQSQRGWAEWAPVFDVLSSLLDGFLAHADAALEGSGK